MLIVKIVIPLASLYTLSEMKIIPPEAEDTGCEPAVS